MAAIEFTRSASSGQLVGGRIINALNKTYATYVAWKAAEATRKELSQLSDHELADIGLCRGDIDNVARGVRF